MRQRNTRSWIPGPATPEGRERALSNLETLAPLKHGVSRWMRYTIAPPCAKCVARQYCEVAFTSEDGACAVAMERQRDLVDGIMSLPHVEDTDFPVVREFAKLTVALELADLWLAFNSPWREGADGEVDARGLINVRMTISRAMRDLARELGLTPASRLRMRTDDTPMAERIARVFAASQKEADVSGEDDE